MDWYYKRWGLALLLLGCGPFALYPLWRSPAVSRSEKWVYTGVISLFTWYIASALYHVLELFNAVLGVMPSL